MADLDIQQLPDQLYRRLAIDARRAYSPRLSEIVQAVVAIPLQEAGDEVTRAVDRKTQTASLTVAAGAGNAQAQLWNNQFPGTPDARWIVLRGITAASATAGRISVRRHSAALATNDPQLSFNLVGTQTQGAGDDGFQHRRTNAGGVLGARLCALQLAANTPFEIRFREPYVICPQWGVHVAHHVAATDLDVTFFFEWVLNVPGIG